MESSNHRNIPHWKGYSITQSFLKSIIQIEQIEFSQFYNSSIWIFYSFSNTYFQLTKLQNYNQLSELIVIQIPKYSISTGTSSKTPNLLGSAKANGREPKGCLGRVFIFKLGCFVS